MVVNKALEATADGRLRFALEHEVFDAFGRRCLSFSFGMNARDVQAAPKRPELAVDVRPEFREMAAKIPGASFTH